MHECEFEFGFLEKSQKHFPTLSTDLSTPFDQGLRPADGLDLVARPSLDHLGFGFVLGDFHCAYIGIEPEESAASLKLYSSLSSPFRRPSPW